MAGKRRIDSKFLWLGFVLFAIIAYVWLSLARAKGANETQIFHEIKAKIQWTARPYAGCRFDAGNTGQCWLEKKGSDEKYSQAYYFCRSRGMRLPSVRELEKYITWRIEKKDLPDGERWWTSSPCPGCDYPEYDQTTAPVYFKAKAVATINKEGNKEGWSIAQKHHILCVR